jgi:hypothetical protein
VTSLHQGLCWSVFCQFEREAEMQHIKFVERNRFFFTAVRQVIFLTYTNENALIVLTCTYIFLAGMLKAPNSSCVQEM